MRTLALPLLSLIACALGPPAVAQDTPDPETLFAAWERLEPAERADTIQWFIAECDGGRDFRSGLERHVLARHQANRFDWPEATEEPPLYDTEVHTPRNPIRRRFMGASSGRSRRTYEKLVGDRHDRAFRPAFEYDWARGTVVKLGEWDDPARIAYNAARGFSPYADLVEALVEMEIDGGEVRTEAQAFAHAYSDRSGRAFRTITLYDAWSSGSEIEMADVECLGILHDIEDDWRTFIAPVPESKHRRLYDKIGEHFANLRKYRALRAAVARSYLIAEPRLPVGYGPSLRLHGFWELRSSDPEAMAKDLPSNDDWAKWFDERAAEADDDPEVVARARARMASLQASRDWARRTFHGILREYGAFGDDASDRERDGRR
ncbi:MAG: hypothetical protein AAGA20_19465 [Planctomycetota bacterium]